MTLDEVLAHPDDRYAVAWMPGVAFWVDGPELEYPPDWGYWDGEEWIEDSEPDPIETGMMLMVMVGDDRCHVIDPDDLTRLDNDNYCHECGQVGCTATSREYW